MSRTLVQCVDNRWNDPSAWDSSFYYGLDADERHDEDNENHTDSVNDPYNDSDHDSYNDAYNDSDNDNDSDHYPNSNHDYGYDNHSNNDYDNNPDFHYDNDSDHDYDCDYNVVNVNDTVCPSKDDVPWLDATAIDRDILRMNALGLKPFYEVSFGCEVDFTV
ncbi:hypothetical protein MRX96_026168 [Rhipicephalus microplus]